MICASFGCKDTCSGDSGGPMTYFINGKPTLVGVTSWGSEQCGTTGYPGVYTEVAAYVNWIETYV